MLRIHFEKENAINEMSAILEKKLKTVKRSIVIVCIGTDRSTGDSLGPLVGSYLEQELNVPVFGTIKYPVHGANLSTVYPVIKDICENPFIIAVDACLGRKEKVGEITIGDGPMRPGAGVNKKLPEVGDIHINGIVNVSSPQAYFILQNTRLNICIEMAKIISESLKKSLNRKPLGVYK